MPTTIASLLALEVPNILPESPGFLRPAGRLIWCSIVLGIGIAVAFIWARQPKKSAEPSTWAASILGGVVVFFLFVLAYGVWPHEWLTFASAHLNWGKDTYILTQDQFASNLPPIDVPRYVLADIVAATSYFVFGTINVLLFSMWQKRTVAEPPAVGEDGEPVEQLPAGALARFRSRKRTSAYGRPVTTSDA
ncbi:MAG: hypothetical protein ABWZ15_09930 [Acidimicrobiia bacterium]